MIELPPTQFLSAQPIFRSTHYGVLAAGTLEGGHPGRVFVDDLAQPRAGLVCTRAGYYFLAGSPAPAFLDELYDLFTGELVPRQENELGSREVVLFFDPPEWHAPLFARFVPLRPLRIRKLRHVLPPGAYAPLSAGDQPPAGLRIAMLSLELIQSNPELAGEAELFYDSVERFMECGLGFCVLDGDTVASTCSAVFVGGGEAEISIHTAEGYRKRGLAYLTARAFIDACHARGLRPVWGCWPENEPSVRLAHKLGFQLDCEQPVCLWVDEEGWNRE